MRSTLTLGLILLATTVADAASPRMRTLRPPGAQRGTEVEVTFTGRRLSDAKEILFYQPGITTTQLKAVDDNTLKATFKIAPEATLGLYDLRIRTSSGVSELKSFSVGALKETAEVEPNNDFVKPQVIAMNTTVNGVADNEDVDYYVVEARKGERITAEVEGIRLGATFFDPYVAILDSKRFEMSASDDASLLWQDGFAAIVAPEDGSYVIQVRDSAYAGNTNCVYRLHVGHFPRPSAVVPGGGKYGETVEVRWIGDVLGESKSKVALPDRPQTEFGIVARDDQGIAPYPNLFRLSSFGNVIESEPNNDPATATSFTPPLALNGVIDRVGDVDQFVFTAKKGDKYEVKVFARALRSPLDAILSIAGRKGGTVGRNDDANGSPDSVLQFSAPADGDYVIEIKDHLLKGGPDYTYRIEVGPIEPRLTLSVPNESVYQRRNPTVAVTVPKGNRGAILVNASRTGFGGDLVVIDAEGLPEGLTLEADLMAATVGTFPVLISAANDAPIAGGLASFVGKPTDPKLNVPSYFQHSVELVTGQNNAPFWTRVEDKFAVVVAEEAPFSIEVVPPKVPLVRSGSMDLKVVATRRDGFTTPIAVSLLWNPPGIGSSGSIVIPEGQNEALIPINASDAAEMKTWRTVAIGTAEVPNPDGSKPEPRTGGRGNGQTLYGTLSVASPLVPLTIAEKYLSFEFQAATVEQGKETDVVVKVTKLGDFDGEAKVTLLGLPNKVTTEPRTVTKDTSEVIFHLTTDAVSPAGNHNTLVCQAVVIKDGEPIVHNLGTGKLRIDAPIASKQPAAGKPGASAVAAKPGEKTEKPVSRLEQLRRERREATANVTAGSANEK